MVQLKKNISKSILFKKNIRQQTILKYKTISLSINSYIDPSTIPSSGASFPYDFGFIGNEYVGPIDLFVHGSVSFNPHHDYAKLEMENWISEMGFFNEIHDLQLNNFLKANYPALMAYVYPTVGPNELADAARLGAWLFIHDDGHDHPDAIHEEFVEANSVLVSVVRGINSLEGLEDKPYFVMATSLKDLLHRYQKYGDLTFFKNELICYLNSNLEKSENKQNKKISKLFRYVRNRRFTSAVGAAFELGYLMTGVTISREDRDEQQFKIVTESGCQSVCFINDIVSLKKGIWEGHAENLVVINKYQLNIPLWKDAIQMTHKNHYRGEVSTFLDKKKNRNYEKVIDDWIKGSTVWSLPNMQRGTTRYASWANKTVDVIYDSWSKE